MTTRSFRQKSLLTRVSAAGLLISPCDAIVQTCGIVGYFEDAASKALARLDDGAAPVLEDCTEYQVVDWCPACIDLFDAERGDSGGGHGLAVTRSKLISPGRNARCDANHQIARANDQGQTRCRAANSNEDVSGGTEGFGG
jgi:hypothetical protein